MPHTFDALVLGAATADLFLAPLTAPLAFGQRGRLGRRDSFDAGFRPTRPHRRPALRRRLRRALHPRARRHSGPIHRDESLAHITRNGEHQP
ncbi:hypothetical protein [Streptomyces sp. NRRL F-5630]|uniref:hypothetical protein n=1 Tax=Streptomyces sp. NRRL F-5630 TaxID=1463864 RepID=UPI003D71CEB6